MKTTITLLLLFISATLLAQTDEIYVHVADASNNNSGYITTIDHPFLNGNPSADIFVTHNYNPGGVGGTLNDNPTGTWYDGSNWTVFNEDFTDIQNGTSYNIYIAKGGSTMEVTVDGSSYSEELSDSELNGNFNAVMIASKYWNPNGIYNTQNYGFWYDDGNQRWNLYAEDLDPQPANASYKILVSPGSGESTAFVHTATAANILNNWTVIDDPMLNGNPDATLVVMHNWGTTGDAANIVHDKVIGVWYTGSNWAIYNEDQSAMTEDLEFNVYIAEPTLAIDDSQFLEISTYPNPTRGQLTITAGIQMENVAVFNVLGQQVKTFEIGDTTASINIEDLSSGQYFIKIQSENATETRKIIKL